MPHPDGFLSYALPISPNWNASIERLVAPSPVASRPPLSHYFSPRLRVTLTHFTLSSYERAIRLPTSIPISGLARLGEKQDSADLRGELLRPFTRSYLLPLIGRFFLLALLFLLEICLCSLWSPPFPLHAPAPIPSLSLTLTLS